MSDKKAINIPLTKEEITLIHEMFKDKIFDMSEGYVYWDKYTYDILNSTYNKMENSLTFEQLKAVSVKMIEEYYKEKFVSTKCIENIVDSDNEYVLKFKTYFKSKSGRTVSECTLVEITPKNDGYNFTII